MAKMYAKKDCQFINHRIVCNGEIVSVDRKVYKMMHDLEDSVQKAGYLLDQPAQQEAPSLDGFKFTTTRHYCSIGEPETPALDEMIANSMAIMQEVDKTTVCNDLNETLKNIHPLIEWVDSEYIIDDNNGCTDPIDLYVLGNPLEIEELDIVAAVARIKNADLHVKGDEFRLCDTKEDIERPVTASPEEIEEIKKALEDLKTVDLIKLGTEVIDLNEDTDGDTAADFYEGTEIEEE